MFKTLKSKMASKIPDQAFALVATFYWGVHPNRETVWLFQKNNGWIVKSVEENPEYSEFLIPHPRMGQKPFAPCDLYDPYSRYFEVEEGDVVLDVGASAGEFTVPAAKRTGENGIVVAVEPEPINLEILRANVRKRNLENVKIVEKAAWSSKTTLDLYIGRGWGDHSVVKSSKNSVEVQADTLDNIIDEHEMDKVDFIKMDIEGAELEALQGAEEVLSRAEKVTIAAYHERGGEKTQFGVQEFLDNRNFETRVSKDGIVHAWR